MTTRQMVQTAALAALAATGLFTTLAADVTLTTSDTTGATSFSAAGHWSSGIAPTAGNQYFTGPYELWTPEGGTANYTFGGSSLTISAGGKLIYAGNGAATLPVISINNWTNSGGLVSARSSANVSFDKALFLTGSGNVLGSGTLNTNLFAGVISGTGGLTIGTGSGSPFVVFTNKNTFTGGITVEAGATLQADGNTPSGSTPAVNPLGANAVTLKSGSKLVLRENGYGSTTPTVVYGNDLVVQGDAALDLTRYSAGTPSCQVRFGNLSVGSNTLTMTSTVGGHWFAQTGNTTLLGDAIFNTAINAFMGKITDGTGSYKVTKNHGSGVLWLGTTASDYDGGTVINAGTLEANTDGNVFGTGDVTVNGGKLNLRYFGNAASTPIKFNGAATLGLFSPSNTPFAFKSLALNAATFSLSRDGAGAMHTLNGPVSNTVAVQVNLTGTTAGNVAIGGANASVTLGGNITFNPTTAGLVVSAPIGETGGARSLTMIGTTNLTLSGVNTYSGSTILNAGRVLIGADSGLGTAPVSATAGQLTFNGGTLATTASFTLSSTRGIAMTGAGTFDTTNGTTLEYGGLIAGGGALAKAGAGTLTLSSTNAYGDTTVRNGTLKLFSANNVLNMTRTLTLDSGAGSPRLELTGNSNSVNYLAASSAGVKVITDSSPTAGTLVATNQFQVLAGTTVVDRVSVVQGNADWNGLFVQNAVLVLTNGTTWKGKGGVIGQNGGNRGQVVIDHATMMQDGGIYMSSFNPDRTSTVSVVNGGLLNADSLYMPWSAGPGVNGPLYGGPSQVDVSNAGLAFGNIYHSYNTNGVTSEAVLTFDNATLGAYRTTGANIASSMTVRVRSGGVTFALGSGTNMTVSSALNEDGSSVGGGLRKAGAGLLTLSSTNTYSGVTSVEAGTLRLNVPSNTLPIMGAVLVASNAVFDVNGKVQALAGLGGSGAVINGSWLTVTDSVTPGGTNAVGTLTLTSTPAALGGLFKVDVKSDGACDLLNVQGNLNVSGMTLQVADTAGLNKGKGYTVATYTGTLTGPFISDNLPTRWLIRYDAAAKRIYLIYNAGTVLRVL